MTRISCLLISLAAFSLFGFSQPGGTTTKIVKADSFCDSLKLVVRNSVNGFIDYRYNELQGSYSLSYSTTLPSLGFAKKFVQTGMVIPFGKKSATTLPFYIATSAFQEKSAAHIFFSGIKSKLISCMKPVASDSASRPGFERYTGFQLARPVKDSFSTVEIILITDGNSNTVVFRMFHSKGSLVKGNMSKPPQILPTDKNHFTQLLPLLEALMEYSGNNFRAVRGTLLENEKWKPTYTSTVRFRDFVYPKIEYVTDNLWNQYTTNFYIKDKAEATRRFNDLITEIDQCKTKFPYQRFEPRSSENEKWWYYDNPRNDVDGKQFKNTLRLSLVKWEYGEGYYLTFEFRKSVG